MSARTSEELKLHYEIEKELAQRLRAAPKNLRGPLYSVVYDELFRRVPTHPQLTRRAAPQSFVSVVDEKLRLLSEFLRPDTSFLELGAGDCQLAIAVAARVRRAYGLDVSREILAQRALPVNFDLIISNGTNIPVANRSISLAFSYQLMEHIHPDDAREQLSNVCEVLAPGGRYVCVTPNALTGPHDISKHFDQVPCGLHLKEYTLSELATLLKQAGFDRVYLLTGIKGHFFSAPVWAARGLEAALIRLPRRLRLTLGELPIIRHFLFSAVVGVKPPATS